MLQQSMLDLRAYRLTAKTDGVVAWYPTSQVYATRTLIVLFLWLLIAIVWLCTVEMPWQWAARQERQERRQELMRKYEMSHHELVAEVERLRSPGAVQPPSDFPSGNSGSFEFSNTAQVSMASEEWRLQVPGWLQTITCILGFFGIYWPISTFANRVVLWRDAKDDIWMRFWFLWPRKRWVGHASSTRLIPRAMQEHLFFRRRHIDTRWNWILQITSETVARLPNSPGAFAIDSRRIVPDILSASQYHDPSPGDKPPQVIQQWTSKVSQALGISAEQQRATHQEVEMSWDGRPIRIARETTDLQFPMSRTEQSIDLSGMSTKELQTLTNAMAQLGQVRNTDDGHVEITFEQANSYEDLSIDQMKAILTALPPELRKHVELSKRKRR
jgi:hypothetical protein